MEAEEEDAPDAEVTFALIAKRCLPADFLESADAQQEGLLHNRRLIGHTTKVNHNTVVYQYRSCHTTPLYCTPGHRTKVNHNTVVYQYGSCHTMPLYCTSALLDAHSVIQCRPITRAGCGAVPLGGARGVGAHARAPRPRSHRVSPRGRAPPQPALVIGQHRITECV